MTKSRLFSGKIKKKSGSELDSSRYQYIDVSQTEPDLGLPGSDGSILISSSTGTRVWTHTLTNITIDNLAITNTTSATSTSTGALTVAGGVGIGKDLYVGGTSTLGVLNATSGTFSGTLGVTGTSTLSGTTNITNTTSATSTSTGALTVVGGVGIGKDLYVGGLLYADRLSINDTQSLTSLIPIQAGTDISVTTNTGIIVVSNISTLQSVTSRGANTNNVISITNTSSSTSGVTGALRVSGGVGIGGNIYADGNINAGGVRTISSSSAPTTPTPAVGDIWYNTTNDRLYRFTSNSVVTFWLDYTGPKIATQANPIVQILAPLAVPGPPTITTATMINSSQVSVTYVAANYDGGTPITAYTARVHTSSGSGVGITQTVNTNIGGTILVSNLSSSTTYTFVVYATNIIGDSINSNVSNSVTTPAQSPVNLIGPTITGTAAINQTLTVNSNGTWSPGGVTFTYQWQRGTGTSPYSFSNIVGATNNSYLLVDADGLLVIKCIITGNNAGGAVPASSNISSAIQPGVPGAPTIGTPIQTGGTTANVPFTVPTTTGGAPIIKYVATAYAYPAGTDTGIYNELLVENLSSPTTGIVNMTGLTFNTSYTFKVTAVNVAGVGPPSNSSIVITTASTTPFAPIIGTATATGQTTANVTFTPPTSNGGAAITSYIIVSNPTGGIGSVNQSIGGTIAVTALITNTNYTFTVSAQNVNGFGPASTSSNSILTFAGVPNVPTGVTATATGQTPANVVFVAPANNGGSTITSYTATSSPADGTGTLTQSGSGTISVTGLYANTNYTFTVTATNPIGTSNPSNPSASILTNPGVPGIPIAVTATATGQTTITVQVTPPANNGGTAITSYYALSDVGGISSTINSSSPGWNTGTFFITGLAVQSPYRFRVRATNSVGTGNYSSYSNTATTLMPIPTIISTPTTYMVNAATLAVGNSIAVVLPGGSWGNSPTSYTYQWTRNKSIIRGGNGVTTAISGATSSTYLIVTADAYTVLDIVVTAYNTGGNASSSSSNNSDVPAVAPTAVILGTAIKTGITTASVPFTPPVSNGGPAIVLYTLTSENGGITQQLTQAGGGTFYVTGLTVATQYRFKIICSNGFFDSPDSGWTNYITTDKDLPNPPTGLTVSTVSNTAILVGYSAPIYTGGTTITSYTAVSTPGGLTGNISTSGSSSIVVNGLDSGTSYTFNAYATNEIGNSTLSTASNSIFTLPTVPNAPTIGTATYGSTDTSIIVSYTAPVYNGGVGATGPGQIITYTAISTPDGITGTTSTYLSGSITINGLVSNRSYTFKVRATNSVGVGLYSNDSNAIIPWGFGTASVLVVAGGGGSAAVDIYGNHNENNSGGAGAGGVIYNNQWTISSSTYILTVGAGGTPGTNGLDSSIVTGISTTTIFLAKGGGAPETAGGSGGGGNSLQNNGSQTQTIYSRYGLNQLSGPNGPGGTSTQLSLGIMPVNSIAYGNTGSFGVSSTVSYGGGGGAGTSTQSGSAGKSGIYISEFSAFGASGYFGGGGGGANISSISTANVPSANGGLGGGGGGNAAGSNYYNSSAYVTVGYSAVGGNGTPNTGGGAGKSAATGGSGVIILRSKYPNISATGTVISTVGSYTYYLTTSASIMSFSPLPAGPLAPTLISVTTASISSITVQYAAPGLAIPVGTTATGFIVTASPTNVNNTVTYTTSTLGSGSLTIPGLSTSTTYNVKVNALSDYGTGLDSNVLSISLGGGVPPAPTLLSVTSGTNAVVTATYTIPTILPSYISSLTSVMLTAIRTTVTNPTTVSIEMLVIGGGGAGGSAGGGGGGFVQTTATINMDTINYITVGAGGSVATDQERGENGQNSSFTSTNQSIIAYGGGAGGRSREPIFVNGQTYWYYRTSPSQGARRIAGLGYPQSWTNDGGSGGSGGGAGAYWYYNPIANGSPYDGYGGFGNSQYSGTRLYDTTGAQHNRNWVTATHIAQTSTAVQGYNGGGNDGGSGGQSSIYASRAGAGGGGAGGVGSNFSYSGNPNGSQNGAAGGHGRVSTMISTTASNTYGIGVIYSGSVYFGGGGGGAGSYSQDDSTSYQTTAVTGGAGGRGGGGRDAEPIPYNAPGMVGNTLRALAQNQQNITPGTNGAGGGGGGVTEYDGTTSFNMYQTAGGSGSVVIRHLTTVTNWKINVSGSASPNGYIEGLYTYYVWTSSGTIQYTRGDSTITTSTTSTISGSITANVNTGSTYNVSIAAINAIGTGPSSNIINIAV